MITIIIPYFNRFGKLKEAIESVFFQTYIDWELFLIDDCSCEENGEIMKYTFGPNGQIIHHRRNSVNSGPGYSRNCGIKEARGGYFVFLDSDDVLESTYLEKMNKEINSELLFVYCSASWSDGSIYKTSNVSYDSVLPTLITESRPWPTVSILWNKLYIPLFNEELRAWEDYLFEFTAALRNNKIRHVNEVLVNIGSADNLSLSNHAGSTSGWRNNIKAIDLMLLQLELNDFWKNLDLVRLLLLKFIHFSVRLQQFEKENNIEFKSRILRVCPRSVSALKVLRKCLIIVK